MTKSPKGGHSDKIRETPVLQYNIPMQNYPRVDECSTSEKKSYQTILKSDLLA